MHLSLSRCPRRPSNELYSQPNSETNHPVTCLYNISQKLTLISIIYQSFNLPKSKDIQNQPCTPYILSKHQTTIKQLTSTSYIKNQTTNINIKQLHHIILFFSFLVSRPLFSFVRCLGHLGDVQGADGADAHRDGLEAILLVLNA